MATKGDAGSVLVNEMAVWMGNARYWLRRVGPCEFELSKETTLTIEIEELPNGTKDRGTATYSTRRVVERKFTVWNAEAVSHRILVAELGREPTHAEVLVLKRVVELFGEFKTK